MQPVAAWIAWLLGALAGVALLVAAVMAWYAKSCHDRLTLNDEHLALVRRDLAEKGAALARAEREISRLRQIPKAELLPMLQLAHEMRSPLASMQGSLDMLLQGYAATNPELQNELLSLARDRAGALLTRVNDFMRLGAIRHAEIERQAQPVQVLDVVHRLAPEMRVRATWRAIDLQLDLPDALPTVTATEEEVEQVFSNLIGNAIKYTKPGGRVTLTLTEDECGVAGIVEDTGIGIAQEDLDKVFQEFYRAKTARDMDAYGTGLGLAIVKRIVELHGGQIRVDSEIGKGSRFTVVFPRSRAENGVGELREARVSPEMPEGEPIGNACKEEAA